MIQWFESPGSPITQQIAIFVPRLGGNVDLGYPSPNSAGNGNNSGMLNVAGSIFANNGAWQSSDSALKKNIEPLTNNLGKIVKLQPIKFEWDSVRDSLMMGKQFGFTAQQVKRVIPEMVRTVASTDEISYTQFAPFIVGAIQEQQLSIDSLRKAPPGSVSAQNGLSLSNTGAINLGQDVNQSGDPARLTNSRQIPMNGNTILLSGQGTLKVGQQAAVANTASVVPTMEVNNSFNTTNNVGLYVKDNGAQSQVNRQGVKIEMNLNNADASTAALDISNSDPTPQSGSAYLIKAKGIDYGAGGVVEKFLLDNYGNSGFNMPPASYNQAAMTVQDRGNLQSMTNPYYSGNGNLYKTLMVNNVLTNPNDVFAASTAIEAYGRGNNGSVNGITAVGECISTANNNRVGCGVRATGISNQPSGKAIGVQADAMPSAANTAASAYGVYGEAKNSTTSNYGITGKAAITTSGPVNYAGYFDGDVNITGKLVGTQFNYPSDSLLKTNLAAIFNACSIIRQLRPKTFVYDTNWYFLKSNTGKNYGLIAQNVEAVLPELVKTYRMADVKDSMGHVIAQGGTFKAVNYNAFISILIAALKEQQGTIDSLKTNNRAKDSIQDARLAALENAVNSCCNNTSRHTGGGNTDKGTSSIDVELSDADIVVLNQNIPNPFAEQTNITYNIPKNAGVAQILFYDVNGRQIKSVDIAKKGSGLLNVYANDLTSGVYSYTLIVDGKIIDTKKMVKQQ